MSGAEVWLEEIKTVDGSQTEAADPLHWAQAKCYGYIYAHDHQLTKISIQLTYLDLETGRLTEFRNEFSFAELTVFFQETTAVYVNWMQDRHNWCQQRDQSIQTLPFPFACYRPGQREVAVAVYRALARGGRLFIEAPTGIGKTISVLFPAAKTLSEGKLERIFYLTARSSGRTVAQKAVSDLRRAGLHLRTLTLTAKEKICPVEGQTCDPGTCPLARGYYDRCKPAMQAALAQETITREVLQALAREHQVCPFELSLDVSAWVDMVICDYNYVFDPRVYLRRHFAEDGEAYAFLVDEAHNLVDRARAMFSADLDCREIQTVRRALKTAVPRCAKALTRLIAALRQLTGPSNSADQPIKPSDPSFELNLFPAQNQETSSRGLVDSTRISRDFPTALQAPLEQAIEEAQSWLAANRPADFRESLLQLYFRLQSFQRTAELYDQRYTTLVQPGPLLRVTLFCLDPSFLLRKALARGKSAIFFSATLTPVDYYRSLLGGSPEDPLLQLPCPFPPQNLAVLVQQRIRTDFKARGDSLAAVVEAIQALVKGRPGNYLVYLPSYQYLTTVQELFHTREPSIPLLVQRPGMTEPERDAFLAAFTVDHRKILVGFAVLGGVFGEGIDLVGDRLIGAVVVGVGLPQLCAQRDLIREYFEQTTGAGFDYAYRFPGMNRVLQATGRVIRSERDRGVILLIDKRLAEPRYRRLLPAWWRLVLVQNHAEIDECLSQFWQSPRQLQSDG